MPVDGGHVSTDNYSPRESDHDRACRRRRSHHRISRRRSPRPHAGGRRVTPVRVAAVGVGTWGRTLADAAARGTGLDIVACTSRSVESRAAFATARSCRALPDYDALLRDPDLEGVLITTPPSAHAGRAVAPPAAGTHAFVEQPFALTVAAARRASEACRRAGVVLAAGHQRRRQAASRAIKRMLDEGMFGRAIQIEGNFSQTIGF